MEICGQEMRDSWRTAQIMTGRWRYSDRPTDAVAFAEPIEDRELLRHITNGRLERERISAAESLTSFAALASHFNLSGDVKPLTTPGAVARVSHRFRGRRATFRQETLPWWTQQTKCVRKVHPMCLNVRDSKGRNSHLAPPTFLLGIVTCLKICDPEDPDFGKCIDLRVQSYSFGDYGLADRAKGKFVAVKRRPLIKVPSLLSDSINCPQRLKGTDDVSGEEAHTDAPLEGLRERLDEDPTVGEVGCESAEHEDVRTVWVLTNMGSAGRNGSRSAVKSSPIPLATAGVSTTRGRTGLSI